MRLDARRARGYHRSMADGAVLHHVCVRVVDPARAEAFYTGLLGLERLWEFTLTAAEARLLYGLDRPCRMTAYAGMQGRLETCCAEGSVFAPLPGQHAAWVVPDRDDLVERLRRAGVPLRELTREGRRLVFCSDPDGNVWELKTS
jgi:catechol 2,3-dioxygenase-like lactoylglutathione lyase family enzyme